MIVGRLDLDESLAQRLRLHGEDLLQPDQNEAVRMCERARDSRRECAILLLVTS